MPEYTQSKPLEQIAGYVGRDPEVKPGRDDSTFTSFTVGVNTGYGEDSETKWYGVAVNRKELQDWVQANIRKGKPIVAEGVSSTVTREGATFNNFTAYRVGIVDWFVLGMPAAPREDEDL